jgi:tRNA dimethylallyltransferase
MNNKIPLLCIVGPTASGKTGLSVELAERYNGEIVSCDSMQIYKGMDIATAKVTKEEARGIPHHLVDFLPIGEAFSVSDYVKLAHKVIAEIYERGKLPILVGGTGLYYSYLNHTLINLFSSSCLVIVKQIGLPCGQYFTSGFSISSSTRAISSPSLLLSPAFIAARQATFL